MGEAWRNWSGSVRFSPARRVRAHSEDEIAVVVREANAQGRSVRVVGSGHSSNGILVGPDVLVTLERLSGVIEADRTRCEARVLPGTTLEELGRLLYEHDLALPNYGDVATQTIGGAIGTGTHGSGRRLHNLSQMLIGARLVDGRGQVREIDATDVERLRAARVALGALGIFTELRLALVPAFDVERREYATSTDAALAHLDELAAHNYSFDFYWYPRRDDVKLRLVNPVGGGTRDLPYARLLERRGGYAHQLIPTHSGLPHLFEECEYAMPADAGVACFRAVRERILARWRRVVGWRVLYRTVAADDADLSTASGRDTVTVSLHQNASLPWRAFFADIEPIFRDHAGRPHWAKKHSLRGERLAALYPRWMHFQDVRAQFDPDGTFLTPQLRRLLGVAA
ncbi:D-arabinono-1,4-lactone oxidase [Vulcaniibacterium thermophilum]|uniref:Oxidoreductase n=1 Tax=Vulcaniibacterium thermophilum TaxID=1169913 RepID=A0A918Z3Q4_9GAMM|nr:D-arabinono-1,4-lactone oxidase [Vulcaniibacterium thermophilum]GHE35279.1 oxidoreductase [Vulcaniibacterium thermophilum]